MSEEVDVTLLLQKLEDGNEADKRAVFDVVYDELHRIAHNYMRREQAGHSLQTTGLVHETH